MVDDFSRFTWVKFLAHKSDAFATFETLVKQLQNEKGVSLRSIRTDHGTEFENHDFASFCDEYGINHNFSAPYTPQQNGVVERKNRTLQDMARTMLLESEVAKNLWAEAVSTACYTSNRVHLRYSLGKTPYELYKGRKPNISYFHPFGSKCYILRPIKDGVGKFDARSDEGIFLGYSLTSKA